jgi:hypothetical protein
VQANLVLHRYRAPGSYRYHRGVWCAVGSELNGLRGLWSDLVLWPGADRVATMADKLWTLLWDCLGAMRVPGTWCRHWKRPWWSGNRWSLPELSELIVWE